MSGTKTFLLFVIFLALAVTSVANAETAGSATEPKPEASAASATQPADAATDAVVQTTAEVQPAVPVSNQGVSSSEPSTTQSSPAEDGAVPLSDEEMKQVKGKWVWLLRIAGQRVLVTGIGSRVLFVVTQSSLYRWLGKKAISQAIKRAWPQLDPFYIEKAVSR